MGSKLRSTFMGMSLCLISSSLFSLGNLIVSTMTEFHPITKTFWRFSGTFFLAIFIVIHYSFKKESITDTFWPLRKESIMVFISLALRSIFGCTSGVLKFYSLKYMPLGDSSVICNSYPVFVSILASVILGESFGGWFMGFATLITLSGVVIVSRPPMIFGGEINEEFLMGVGFAIGCALFMAVAIVFIRHLRGIHQSITLISHGAFGTLESGLLSWGFNVFELPQKELDIIQASSLGFLFCTGQILMIMALKCENAAPIALVKTSDVIFSFMWQMLIIQQMPDYISLIGAMVMMSGIFLCGFKKYLQSLDEDHHLRRKFSFVFK